MLPPAKAFYGGILSCEEGRSSTHWQVSRQGQMVRQITTNHRNQCQDYNLYGHQLVVHQVTKEYRGVDYFNPVGALSPDICGHCEVVLIVSCSL